MLEFAIILFCVVYLDHQISAAHFGIKLVSQIFQRFFLSDICKDWKTSKCLGQHVF